MAKVITTELQHSGASGANITLGSSKDVTFNGTVTGDNDTKSFRRLNINGDMTVAQRGTSASLTGNNNSQDAYRVVDRYSQYCRSDAVWTYSQESDGPAGFAKSFKALCTTADSSVAANVYEQFVYTFEGQDVQHLKKGTSSAESITISFWVKSNKTGTYILEVRDLDNNRHISKSYTISSSATWEKKTITYAGDTTGALDNDNAASLRVYWWLAAGSDKSSGTLATSWAATTEANRAAGQVQLTDTNNNYWQITGVQIEVGTTATDFEHRSYTDEINLCKRYFNMIVDPSTDTYSDDKGRQPFMQGLVWNKDTKDCRFRGTFNVPMRASPSLYKVVGTAWFRIQVVAGVNTTSDWTLLGSWKEFFELKCTAIDSFGSDDAGMSIYAICFNSGARIGWDAEI